MSGAAAGSGTTAKLGDDKKTPGEPTKDQPAQAPPALLEEDDEFEDFPVEGTFWISERSGLHRLIRVDGRLDGRGEQSTGW